MRIVLVVAQQIVIALLQRVTAKPFAADYLSSRVDVFLRQGDETYAAFRLFSDGGR